MTLLNYFTRHSLLLALLSVVFASGCGSSQNFVFTGNSGPISGPGPVPGTAPTVVFVSPANGEILAPINGQILAIFSEAMNPQTLNNSSFTLTTGGQAVAGTVVTFGRAALFAPTSNFIPGTTYTPI